VISTGRPRLPPSIQSLARFLGWTKEVRPL
jgi:hypothetical protein